MLKSENGREFFPIELFINVQKKEPNQNNHVHSQIADGGQTTNNIVGITSFR